MSDSRGRRRGACALAAAPLAGAAPTAPSHPPPPLSLRISHAPRAAVTQQGGGGGCAAAATRPPPQLRRPRVDHDGGWGGVRQGRAAAPWPRTVPSDRAGQRRSVPIGWPRRHMPWGAGNELGGWLQAAAGRVGGAGCQGRPAEGRWGGDHAESHWTTYRRGTRRSVQGPCRRRFRRRQLYSVISYPSTR